MTSKFPSDSYSNDGKQFHHFAKYPFVQQKQDLISWLLPHWLLNTWLYFRTVSEMWLKVIQVRKPWLGTSCIWYFWLTPRSNSFAHMMTDLRTRKSKFSNKDQCHRMPISNMFSLYDYAASVRWSTSVNMFYISTWNIDRLRQFCQTLDNTLAVDVWA